MTRKVEGKQREQLTNGLESAEQRAIIKWWDTVGAVVRGFNPVLLYHVPSGGSRDYIEACQLKLQGVRRGIPDLFLAVPASGYHGLYIELKRPQGGVLSEPQKLFLELARAQGYCAWCCEGADSAKDCITSYLESGVAAPVSAKDYIYPYCPFKQGRLV